MKEVRAYIRDNRDGTVSPFGYRTHLTTAAKWPQIPYGSEAWGWVRAQVQCDHDNRDEGWERFTVVLALEQCR